MIDEIAIFAKSVRIAEVLAVESRFPPHPHIKNNVLSGDEIFESVPFIPQSLIGIFRIGLASPVPLPELFLVLVLPIGEQTSEHHPKHLDSIHFYQFLSFRCTNIIPQIWEMSSVILHKRFTLKNSYYFYMFNILKKKQNSWYVLIFFVLLLI